MTFLADQSLTSDREMVRNLTSWAYVSIIQGMKFEDATFPATSIKLSHIYAPFLLFRNGVPLRSSSITAFEDHDVWSSAA